MRNTITGSGAPLESWLIGSASVIREANRQTAQHDLSSYRDRNHLDCPRTLVR
jgi:hypothetical protein